jgi:hypothetical protein
MASAVGQQYLESRRGAAECPEWPVAKSGRLVILICTSRKFLLMRLFAKQHVKDGIEGRKTEPAPKCCMPALTPEDRANPMIMHQVHMDVGHYLQAESEDYLVLPVREGSKATALWLQTL